MAPPGSLRVRRVGKQKSGGIGKSVRVGLHAIASEPAVLVLGYRHDDLGPRRISGNFLSTAGNEERGFHEFACGSVQPSLPAHSK